MTYEVEGWAEYAQDAQKRYRATASSQIHQYERIVLGWFLDRRNAPHIAAEAIGIEPRHFDLPAHEIIYQTISKHAGVPDIDIRVVDSLIGPNAPRALNALDEPLPSYISTCVTAADLFSAENMRHYAGLVRQAWTKRHAVELMGTLSRAFDAGNSDATFDAWSKLGEMLDGRPVANTDTPAYGDIAALLAGGIPPPPAPDYLHRDDGVALFYRGKVNTLFGDPECGKTWIALAAVTEVLNRGGKAAVLDLDHNGMSEVVQRLILLGANPQALTDVNRFRYCEPEDAHELHWYTDDIAAWAPDIATVDSLGEMIPMLGLNSNSPDDFTNGNRRVLTRIANSGAAVIAIDHLPKDEDARQKGQTGTIGKKRAANGATLRVTVKDQFTPGAGGSANITIGKDRPGGLRGHCPQAKNAPAGRFVMTQDGDMLRWHVTKPDAALTASESVSDNDLAELAGLVPPPTSKRDVQVRCGWGSDRAQKALSKWRELQKHPEIGPSHA